jgi:hypothetical protein
MTMDNVQNCDIFIANPLVKWFHYYLSLPKYPTGALTVVVLLC